MYVLTNATTVFGSVSTNTKLCGMRMLQLDSLAGLLGPGQVGELGVHAHRHHLGVDGPACIDSQKAREAHETLPPER